jgi:hypothetical protein
MHFLVGDGGVGMATNCDLAHESESPAQMTPLQWVFLATLDLDLSVSGVDQEPASVLIYPQKVEKRTRSDV